MIIPFGALEAKGRLCAEGHEIHSGRESEPQALKRDGVSAAYGTSRVVPSHFVTTQRFFLGR